MFKQRHQVRQFSEVLYLRHQQILDSYCYRLTLTRLRLRFEMMSIKAPDRPSSNLAFSATSFLVSGFRFCAGFHCRPFVVLCRVLVKTRSNSFHSTLEPNTEVFSKVSRSLAQFTLVNSVSTLLNKGGITCNCPKASQDFFVNQNKQASAQLLCSSLVLSRHERSEGRRNSCEAEKPHLLRATRTSSRMSQGHLWCLALIMANTKHVKHAKSMSQTCQGSCRCLFR